MAILAPPPEGAPEGGAEVPSDWRLSDTRSFGNDSGRVASAPSSTASVPSAPTGSVPWRPTFEAYAAEAKLAPSTIKRWVGVLTALEEAIATDDLALVTRGDLIAWKRDLLASGRDPRTVRDAHIAATKALMNWAVAKAISKRIRLQASSSRCQISLYFATGISPTARRTEVCAPRSVLMIRDCRGSMLRHGDGFLGCARTAEPASTR